MTRARSDSRRGGISARETERDARRDRIRDLLSRADQGVLTPEESAVLRGDVEAEIVECDTHRRSAGGQQAAAMRLHKRIEAAEDAIREIEAERDELLVRLSPTAATACAVVLRQRHEPVHFRVPVNTDNRLMTVPPNLREHHHR